MNGRHRHRTVLLTLGWLLAAGCSKGPVAPPSEFIVQYSLLVFGNITMDSVRYDNGAGAFVTVTTPPAGWTATATAHSPGAVEIIGWGNGAPTSSARLLETWTANGVSSRADSNSVSTIAPGKFTLPVARHTF